MSRIKALILDFDGVLVESNEAKSRAFQDLFALYPKYQDAMMEYHMANYSSPRMTKFEHFVHELMGRPGDLETAQKMARQFSEFTVGRVMACPAVPGAKLLLDELSLLMPLYVSSVTPQDELRKLVLARGISSYFKGVFGDPPLSKSEAICTVLAQESLSPPEVVLVGDSASDYRAAVDTGIQFVGRNSGMPFDGIEVELCRDLYQVAEEISRRLKG